MTADERISHLFTYADAVRQLIEGGVIERGFASRDAWGRSMPRPHAQ